MSDVVLFGRTQDALGTPFNPTADPDCALVSTDAQGAIYEVCNQSAVSASPGLSWGRSGNLPSGTWLLCDAVPSNKAGRTILIANGKIVRLSVGSETLDTYTLQIYLHDGDSVNLNLIHSVSVVSARSQVFVVPNISVTLGRQLAVFLSAGSAKNLVVGMIAKGTAA